jgi:hypothetical protein
LPVSDKMLASGLEFPIIRFSHFNLLYRLLWSGGPGLQSRSTAIIAKGFTNA